MKSGTLLYLVALSGFIATSVGCRPAPGTPTEVVAEAGGRSAHVRWVAPPAQQDAGPVSGYRVLAQPGDAAVTTSGETEATVEGLANDTTYTFTVVALNGDVPGKPSLPSNAIVTPDVPTVPENVEVTPGKGSVTLRWSAPAHDGGSPISGYGVVTSPGDGKPVTTTGAGLTLSLPGRVAYTFKVYATNAAGDGPPATHAQPVSPACAQLRFPNPPTFFGGTVLADLDGDGHVDLVSANTWSRGHGDGTFSSPIPVSNRDSSLIQRDVKVVDLNGDGKLDILVAQENASQGVITVSLNRGNTTFSGPVTYPAGAGAYPLAVADFDGDGKVDIAVGGEYDTAVTVLAGNGDGSFLPGHRWPVGYMVTQLQVGDVNGDGHPDLIVSVGQVSTIALLAFQRDGTFAAPEVIYTSSRAGITDMVLTDMNGDGRPDLVVAYAYGWVDLALGAGRGHFTVPQSYPLPTPTQSWHLVVVDVDGDGHLDVVVSNYDTFTVMSGRAPVALAITDSFVHSGLTLLGTADVNEDGHPDLVLLNPDNESSVLLGDGAGSFITPEATLVGEAPVALLLRDLDNDGYMDAVVADETANVVGFLRRQSTGGFAPQVTYATGQKPTLLAAADLDGDGRLDVVTANAGDGTLSLLRGRGDGSFEPQRSLAIGDSAQALLLQDFDEDGRPEIVVATGGYTVNARILHNTGGGSFNAPTDLPGPADFVLSDDLNGDGHADLILLSDDRTSVLLGDGRGGFTAHPFALSFSGPAALADVNGDGKKDLLLPGKVLLGRGDGTFGPVHSFSGAEQSGALAIADFDLDGRLDLASTNGSGVRLWLGNGDGTFAAPLNFDTLQMATAVAAAPLAAGQVPSIVTLISGWRRATGLSSPGYVITLVNECR